MSEDILKVLISKEEIKKKTTELAKQITNDYMGEDLVLIGVLKGGFIFLADIMREIDLPVYVDLISVSSYGSGTKTSGNVKLRKDIDINIENKNVLIVEDIIDSGNSVYFLKRILKDRKPKSVKVCSLLDKPQRREVNVQVEYCGFEIPDEFVIGYGLDYNEKYRELADICILDPKVYQE